MTDKSVPNKNRGFIQVVRTTENDLDPLSFFALESNNEKEPIHVVESNESSLKKMDKDHSNSYTSLNRTSPSTHFKTTEEPLKKPKNPNEFSENLKTPDFSKINLNNNADNNFISNIHSKTITFNGSDLNLLQFEKQTLQIHDCSIYLYSDYKIRVHLFLTNYRLILLPNQKDIELLSKSNPCINSYLNIPLFSIDRIEKDKKSKEGLIMNSLLSLTIYCKDFRIINLNLKSGHHTPGTHSVKDSLDLEKAFKKIYFSVFPNDIRRIFAFAKISPNNDGLERPISKTSNRFWSPTKHYDCVLEFSRLGVLDSNHWRVSHANKAYNICSSYPKILIAPSTITDDELFVIAHFRSGKRLPTLSWHDRESGATLWRSSQPKVGVAGASCYQDEKMLDSIAKSCAYHHHKSKFSSNQDDVDPYNEFRPSASRISNGFEPILFIVDCRSRTSAMANRAAGAGYESSNNYPHCKLDFYNIPNIHGVRDSYKALASLLLNVNTSNYNPTHDLSFMKQVEDTQWLPNIRSIIKASWETADMIRKGNPVLVHCSHGWDRTAQVCSLSQVFLDYYYRTFEGFKVLIEKEWVSFGHPFQLRSGHGLDKSYRQEDQISPIFLQFLDCLWQIQKLYPQYFEFNSSYLLTLADHIYSGRFGNFLFNCDQDRDKYESKKSCFDIWEYFEAHVDMFKNPLYINPFLLSQEQNISNRVNPKDATLLLPPLSILLRNVGLWTDYFFRWSSVPSFSSLPNTIYRYLHMKGRQKPLYIPDSEHINLRPEDLKNQELYTQNGTEVFGDSLFSILASQLPSSELSGPGHSIGEFLYSSSSNDFWLGAYQMEREKRIKWEVRFNQLRKANEIRKSHLQSILSSVLLDDQKTSEVMAQFEASFEEDFQGSKETSSESESNAPSPNSDAVQSRRVSSLLKNPVDPKEGRENTGEEEEEEEEEENIIFNEDEDNNDLDTQEKENGENSLRTLESNQASAIKDTAIDSELFLDAEDIPFELINAMDSKDDRTQQNDSNNAADSDTEIISQGFKDDYGETSFIL